MSGLTAPIRTTLAKLSSLITSGSRGWAEYYAETGALFLRMTNLPKEGIRLLLHDNKYVALPSSSSEGKRTSVQQNDILISITAELGKIGFVESDPGEAYVNQHVALVRISSSRAHPKFLAYYLAEAHQRHRWQRLNDAGAKAGLNLQAINKYPVTLPPLEQQIAVASILSTWDNAIEKTERLIEAKEKRLSWLLNRLLNRGSEKGKWRRVKLGEVCSLSKGQGLSKEQVVDNGKKKCILYGELYTTYPEIIFDIKSFTNSSEGVLSRAGDILIPASTTTTGIDLANASALFEDNVLLGGDINILRQKKRGLYDSQFLAYYLTHAKKDEIASFAQGITIVHLYGCDLQKINLSLPSLDQQQQIASVLNIARQEIDLLKKQAVAYRKQKRGLMQKLLTGEWRVGVD